MKCLKTRITPNHLKMVSAVIIVKISYTREASVCIVKTGKLLYTSQSVSTLYGT